MTVMKSAYRFGSKVFIIKHDEGADVSEVLEQIADKLKFPLDDVEEVEVPEDTEELICRSSLEQLAEEIVRTAEERMKMLEYCIPELEDEKPEPHPQYRSKFWKYDKRRKFINKPYWNRVRSRLFK